MCIAICYSLEKQIFIVHFTDTAARVPLVCQRNPEHFLPWGRRIGEPGKLPLGGTISLELRDQAHYDQFFPKPVKIKALKFMEIDVEGRPRWFEVTQGQYLQGFLLRDCQEQRIYVATFMPKRMITPFARWPLLMADLSIKGS